MIDIGALLMKMLAEEQAQKSAPGSDMPAPSEPAGFVPTPPPDSAGLPIPPDMSPAPPAPPAPPVPQAVPPAPPPAPPVPPPAPPEAPPLAPEDPPPAGAPAPAPVAEAYKSPPDLVGMYEKLMERSKNAAALDKGMTLIAAGLAQDQNKEALIRMASSAGGGSGTGPGGLSMESLIQLQKMQQEQENLNRQRAQIPALISKYKLDPATATYLDATGQLDDTLAKLADPETEVITDAVTKGQKLINLNTGETIKELSDAPPRPTEYVELGDGSKKLVYSDDKTEVSTGKRITDIAAPLETEIVKAADGSNVLTNKKTGENMGIVTPAADPEKLILDRADGSKALILKKDGSVVSELSPPTVLNAEEKDSLATINAERAKQGKPPMGMEEFLKMSKGGVNIYTGDNGVKYPEPAKDYMYDMTPEGTVKIYPEEPPSAGHPNGIPAGPRLHLVPGSASELDAAKKAQEIADAKAAAAKTGGSAEKAAVSGDIKANIITQSIDDSLAMLDAHKDDFFGVTGIAANLGSLPMNTPQRTLGRTLDVIKNNIAIDQLQAMRAESKSGGALGSVTEGEERLLKSVLGSIDQYGDAKVLARDLRRLKAGMDLVVNGVYDPEHPTLDPRTGQYVPYRAPTEAEVATALNAAHEEPAGSKTPLGGVIKKGTR